MMTIADLYNDTTGRLAPPSPQFSSALEPSWRGDPRSNPALMPANADYELLAQQDLLGNLTDELMKRGQAKQAKQQADVLKALLERGDVNLFNPPTNPADTLAQKLVQERINAGQRGVNLSFADAARRRKEVLENTKLNMDLQKQAQQNAMFPITRARAIQEYQANKTQQSDLNRYREDQVAARVNAQKYQQQAQQIAQQDRDYNRALHLIETEGAHPNDLMQAFPNLSNEHFMALDAAGQALARGDQREFDTIKKLAQDRTDELNQKVYGAESDYLDRNQGRFTSVPEDVLMKRGAAAREEYLTGFNKDKNAGKSIYFDEASGTFMPIGAAPEGYTPLDRAMLARRRGGSPIPMSGQPLPVPPDGIPIVRTPGDVNYFSGYPTIRSTDGRVKRNPLYRPRAAAPPARSVPAQDWTTGTGNYGDAYLAPSVGDFAY